ncbi:MAG: hypothetical protein HUU29_04635 [Planctomycetaceae bacterium]|nr:hypothetical protein [Planctomycetaceae bacterium]
MEFAKRVMTMVAVALVASAVMLGLGASSPAVNAQTQPGGGGSGMYKGRNAQGIIQAGPGAGSKVYFQFRQYLNGCELDMTVVYNGKNIKLPTQFTTNRTSTALPYKEFWYFDPVTGTDLDTTRGLGVYQTVNIGTMSFLVEVP